jgi:hypothetical protein
MLDDSLQALIMSNLVLIFALSATLAAACRYCPLFPPAPQGIMVGSEFLAP